MNEKSGGIDASSSANIDGLKKNMGGGGGKNNSVFAASLRELSQPNYYRYIFMFKICRMSNLLLIGTRDTSCCEIFNHDSYSQICFTGIVWLPVASTCRQSLLPLFCLRPVRNFRKRPGECGWLLLVWPPRRLSRQS